VRVSRLRQDRRNAENRRERRRRGTRCARSERRIRSSVGRYYDPATGQFLSVDPLADDTGQPYAYTDGDPVVGSDPSGLEYHTEGLIEGQEAVAEIANLEASQERIGEADAPMGAADPVAKPINAVPTGDPVTGQNLAGNTPSSLDTQIGSGERTGQCCPLATESDTDEAARAEEGDALFRTGTQTDNGLTDPTGVSFRSSISSSSDQQQPFRPGAKIWSIDTSQLPGGSADVDNDPDGHLSVDPTPEEIRAAIIAGRPDKILEELGLKPLTDPGAYKSP
jgi:RHS repeat-associated protein